MACFKTLTDRRFCVLVLLIWLVVQAVSFIKLGGAKRNDFIRFSYGPSHELMFLGIVLDTWEAWGIFNAVSVLDVVLNVWCSEMIGPWITNDILDPKAKVIPYSKCVTMLIVNFYNAYLDVRGTFQMFIAFTQVDIIFIRIAVDCIVSTISSWTYIAQKEVKDVHYFEQLASDDADSAENELTDMSADAGEVEQ